MSLLAFLVVVGSPFLVLYLTDRAAFRSLP